MAKNRYIRFNPDLECTALHSLIAEIVPRAVCSIPEVSYYRDGHYGKVNNVVLQTNLKAIMKAWTFARWNGVSSIEYCPIENHLSVCPYLDDNMEGQKILLGQVNKGLLVTERRQNTNIDIYYVEPRTKKVEINFFGRPDALSFTGHSIFTKQLEAEISAYNDMLMDIALRVKVGHGAMLTLAGLDYQDAPLVQGVKDELLSQWQKSNLMLAPIGSSLEAYANTLTDADKVTKPLQEGISAESGVPYYLLFPSEFDSQFKLEARAVWATSMFNQEVMLPLNNLLLAQGYDVLDIQPPNYRDSKYIAEVENINQDTRYKDASTKRSLQQAKTLEIKNEIGPLEFLEESEKIKAKYQVQAQSKSTNDEGDDLEKDGEEGTGGGQGRVL